MCDHRAMPTLLPKAYAMDSMIPCGWVCSECEDAFFTDRMAAVPTQDQIDHVNADFAKHCADRHPKAVPVIGV